MSTPANHRKYSDGQFMERLELFTLRPEDFIHEAHLRMAWLYFHQNGYAEGVVKITGAIRGLDNKYAAGKNYHHTKTVFFSRIIWNRMKDKPCEGWQAFLAVNERLAFSKKILGMFYSDHILGTELAKREFVEPDLEPLPS